MKRVTTVSVQLVREQGKLYNLETVTVRSPEDAANIFRVVFETDKMTRENFLVMYLDTKNKVINTSKVFSGTLNSSIVHPREVFQVACLSNAASIIVGHNHPSGDTSPSQEDIQVTRRLQEAGKVLGIEVLDHVILGFDGNYISLKEKGYL